MTVPYTFATQNGTIPLNELDANFSALANAVPALALAAGTVTQGTQSNITAVGTLSSLTVTGGVTAGSLSGIQIYGTIANASQPNINEIGILQNLTVANTLLVGSLVTTAINTTSIVGTVSTASQPLITQVGTLTSLAVTGNANANIFNSTDAHFSGIIYGTDQTNTGDFYSNNISATSGITGTLKTNAQPNITTVGTLGSLSVTGNITSGNLSATALTGTLRTNAQPNITSVGTLSSLTVTGAVTGNTIAGTLTTAAQPNITSVGTLDSLTVSGVATAPTAANGTSNTQVATTAFVANSLSGGLPSGVIVMWSGSVASIPSGWLLCNGSSGTPDLRNRFVVGAGSTYNPDDIGGSANAVVVSHTHTATSSVTDAGHTHTYAAPSGSETGGSFGGTVVDNIVGSTTGSSTTGISVSTTVASAGVSGTNANLPPYYALAYIMKA